MPKHSISLPVLPSFLICFVFILKLIKADRYYLDITIDDPVDLSTETLNTLSQNPTSIFTYSKLNETHPAQDAKHIKVDYDDEYPTIGFISSNFKLEDLYFTKDGERLIPGEDLLYDLEISNTVVPRSRFYSDPKILVPKERDSVPKDVDICGLYGGGISYSQNKYYDETFHEVESFGKLAFSIFKGQNGIKVKKVEDSTISFMSLDTYIQKMKDAYPDKAEGLVKPTDGVKFTKLWVSNQPNIVGGHLIGQSEANSLYIWNITQFHANEDVQETKLTYWTKFQNHIGSRLHRIAFHNDLLMFGSMEEGLRIYRKSYGGSPQNNTNSTGNSTTNNTDSNSRRNLDNEPNTFTIVGKYSNFSEYTEEHYQADGFSFDLIRRFNYPYKDFLVNFRTIYTIEKNIGLRVINLFTLDLDDKIIIENPELQEVDFLHSSLYNLDLGREQYYVGVSALNSPPARPEFFFEIVANDEYNPTYNRVFVSTKKREFDNAVTNLNTFTAMYDKAHKEMIFIKRGVPNIIDIPSYILPVSPNAQLSLNSGYNPIKILYDAKDNDPTYMVQDRDDYFSITNVRIAEYRVLYRYTEEAKYELNIDFISKCESIDYKSQNNYCEYKAVTVFNVEKSNHELVAVLVILLLILITVVVLLVLVKKGIICKKKGRGQDKAQAQNYGQPQMVNNDDKVEVGEIEINIQHQQLEDEKGEV